MIYYVDCHAAPGGDGSKEHPFDRIQLAAERAAAGDEVKVLPGIYREDVSPVNAGTADQPICYSSVEPRGAVITGAEIVDNWEPYEGDVWKTKVSNAVFGKRNPYTLRVFGDWLEQCVTAHTGDVFLNGKSLYERNTLEEVLHPEFDDASWDRDFTKHTWYTCQDENNDETILFANFQGKDPNQECVEITVRPHCFYPEKEHVNYITLRGFIVKQAATQWAPPTALQEGMVGPHWSKGWVIEDCEITESKCSGISFGKYYQEGNDNKWTLEKFKDGTQTQRDCSLIAQLDGWSKETIGSHIVRNCDIHDCGQAGIVGNLGCVFSVIENNHIHHINNKRNLLGAELGGIKFHAAIDVIIRNNQFHDCVRGVWLDWQCQGTRVSSNYFYNNCMPKDYLLKEENKRGMGMGEDLFIEIAHGPTLVDNNVFLSERCVRLASQGVAFVHNLFYGAITAVGRGAKNGSDTIDSTRYTPIHRPHSTDITGFMSVLHGDVRFYNNVFVQPNVRQGLTDICGLEWDQWDDENLTAGTCCYNEYPTEEEWKSRYEGYCGQGSTISRDIYYMPMPIWTGGNVFFNGAQPCDSEKDYILDTEHEIVLELEESETGKPILHTNLMEHLPTGVLISTDTLGMAFEPEERFEGPDGEEIIFDTDIDGKKRTSHPAVGPFAE